MRVKFNKEIEFFFKKNFLSQSYLLKKGLKDQLITLFLNLYKNIL